MQKTRSRRARPAPVVGIRTPTPREGVKGATAGDLRATVAEERELRIRTEKAERFADTVLVPELRAQVEKSGLTAAQVLHMLGDFWPVGDGRDEPLKGQMRQHAARARDTARWLQAVLSITEISVERLAYNRLVDGKTAWSLAGERVPVLDLEHAQDMERLRAAAAPGGSLEKLARVLDRFAPRPPYRSGSPVEDKFVWSWHALVTEKPGKPLTALGCELFARVFKKEIGLSAFEKRLERMRPTKAT